MKSFLNACGFWEPLRLIVEGPQAAVGEPRTLPQPFAVLGRDPRADMILDDLKVSRRHVYIQAVAGQIFWVDLESRTGTCDETGTRKWGWLGGAGLLQIGPFVIRRAGGDDPAGDFGPREAGRESPLAVRAFGREPLPEVGLEFLNGPSQATVWPMNRVMSLIGSAQGCKFRLTDPSVSAFHASLLRTPTGLWAVDLRGGRSITVNADPVRFGPLADGDVLGIGRYRMKVRCRESKAADNDPDRDSSAAMPVQRLLGGLARRPASGGLPALSAFAGTLMPMPPSPNPAFASAELVASDVGLHGRIHPEVSDSVLVPLVNQFSMMQQQMFDQFQQAMGMLVTMFSSMHREQMEVIREELDRLHELSRELQELKEQLAGSPGRQAPAPSPAGPAAAPIPPEAAAPTRPAAAAAVDDRRPFETPTAKVDRPAGPAPAEAPSAEVPPAAAAGPRRPARPAVAPSPRPNLPPAPPPPTGPRPDQRPPGVAAPGAVAAPGSAGSSQDAVAWIHQRIASIQQERETRWQKIIKILPGMS
jgi:pSer/pThr/pTyr-binding forkhead associated (FHA) protein